MRVLFFIILLLFGSVWCNAQDKDAARSIWMDGYEAMNRADKAVKDNSPLMAVKDYEQALEVFRKVQKDYPDWNAGLINYRIKYCQEKIDGIRKDNQDNMAFLTREELLAKITVVTGDNQTLKNSILALQDDLSAARKSLERARAEAAGQAALEENLRIIRNDRDTLAQQVQLLTAQLATVKEDLAKALLPSPQLQQLPELQKQLSDATSRLSALNREMSALVNARDDLLDKYKRENTRNNALSSKIVETQKKNSEVERQLRQIEERLAERDNELLRVRGELVRVREENSRKLTQVTDEEGAKLRKLEVMLKNREEQLSSVRGELLTVKRKLEVAEQNATRLNEEVEEMKKRNITASAELATTEADSAEQKRLREQLEKLNQQIIVQKELIASLEKENKSQQNSAEYKEKLQAEQRERQKLNDRLAAEQQLREELQVKLDAEIHARSEFEKQVKNANEKFDEERRVRNELDNKIAASEKINKELEEKLNTEQSVRKQTEVLLANGEKEIARLKNALNTADSAAIAASSANDVAMNAFKRQLDEARHELQQIKDKEAETAKQLDESQKQIAQLRRQREEYTAIEQQLRAQLQTQQQDLIQKNEKLSEELKQREMRDKAQDGIMAEARDNAKKIQELNDELAKVKNDLTNSLIANETLKQQSAKEKADNEKLFASSRDEANAAWRVRLQEAQNQVEKAEKKQQELEMALIRRENERKQLTGEIRRLEIALNKSEEKFADARKNTLFAVTPPSDKTAVAQPPVMKETPQKNDLLSDDEIVMRGYLRQGVAAERTGKQEAAVFNYNEALKISPDSLLALKRLGIIAFNNGKNADAAKYLERAMRLSPDDREILVALGFTQLRLNQPRWALANLARASAVAPNDGATSRLFATALGALQWREAAIAEYRHALEINSKDAEAAYNLALMALAYSSEIALNAQNDPQLRDALKRYAQYQRTEGLKWYRHAIDNGAQPDPALEAALKK